jgi:hypothetical protein
MFGFEYVIDQLACGVSWESLDRVRDKQAHAWWP